MFSSGEPESTGMQTAIIAANEGTYYSKVGLIAGVTVAIIILVIVLVTIIALLVILR